MRNIVNLKPWHSNLAKRFGDVVVPSNQFQMFMSLVVALSYQLTLENLHELTKKSFKP